MQVSDIDLSALLQFRPDEGKLLLGDRRMLVFAQSALGTLTEVLVSHLGHELTSSVFAQFGYRSGFDDYSVISQALVWDSEEDQIASGPVLHMWEGIVAVTTEKLTYDRATGAFHMLGTWRNSYEAENYLQLFGLSPTPVCASLTGYASGWSSAFLGQRVLAIETSCQACGDEVCTFEIKPWDEWGSQAEPWRRALQATPHSVSSLLEHRVATRTAELAESNRLLMSANTEAEQARQTAETASAAKSRFLARMSHELRTPMNGVMGIAQLLQSTDLNPEQRDLIGLLLAAGERQMRLITNLLNFADLDLGRLDVTTEQVGLAVVLEEALADVAPRAQREGVRLAPPSQLSSVPDVLVDPVRLREVLGHLLDNAVKFTPAGGEVRVAVTQAPTTVTIAVSDTGMGIAPSHLASLFEPFRQGDQSVTRRFGGAGLGLAVATELVDLMGGTIAADSELGCGTTVRVTLPRMQDGVDGGVDDEAAVNDSSPSLPTALPTAPPSATATQPAAPPEPAPRAQTRDLIAGIRIVVAEDDAVSAIVITRMLQSAGAVVSLARDGGEAIRMVAAEDPDVVFLDLHMPVADGISVAKVIRAAEVRAGRPPRPVIALTADVFEETRRKCFEAGFTEFLTKPARRDQVEAALASVLAGGS